MRAFPHFPATLTIALCASYAGPARAQKPDPPAAQEPAPEDDDLPVSGALRGPSEAADPAREVANVLLYIPRGALDLLFLTSGTAAGLMDDEQVIPRLEDTFYTADHSIGVFPTAFVETGFNPNIGARMIASTPDFAATLRGGYGGPDANIVETRMRTATLRPVPGALSLEAMHDRRTGLGFVGLGPTPESDPRNAFSPDSELRGGSYREIRERLIVNFGFRPLGDAELLFSSSYRRRKVDDAPDAGASALSEVFVPGSVPGAFRRTRNTYTEFALRWDTRAGRGAPTSGWMVEAYSGMLRGIQSRDGNGIAVGGRGAVFVPVYRRSNILSPRIAIDAMAPSDTSSFPFQEYAYPADFRGVDPRRDRIAVVASVDYRWVLVKYVASRIFMDASTVTPELSALDLGQMRYAWGLGFDLHSSTTEIARIAASASADGYRFFFSLGVAPSGFGDRQHR